jgi:hypothetical protein
MGLRNTFFRVAGQLAFERPARKRSLAEHGRDLSQSGAQLLERLVGVSPRPEDRQRMRHIIGIERWGQRRLQVFLGEPFVRDGHHPYKPDETLDWPALLEAFKDTRRHTIALIDDLAKPGAHAVDTVAHNDFGALSTRGWLRYLKGHAEQEARRIP